MFFYKGISPCNFHICYCKGHKEALWPLQQFVSQPCSRTVRVWHPKPPPPPITLSCLCVCVEEGADPESIEKVAQQVLAISLPVNRTIMDNLVDQIKDIIVNLTDVEAVFNRTSEELQKAKDLLNRAHDAK